VWDLAFRLVDFSKYQTNKASCAGFIGTGYRQSCSYLGTTNMNRNLNRNLYALSIREPWAFCILNRGKDIENRKWSPWRSQIGKRILIHAPKKFDQEGYKWLESETEIIVPKPGEYQLGGIVGECLLSGVITEPRGENDFWFTGPFGWILEQPSSVEFHPCRGQLGFWRLPPVALAVNTEET